MSDKKAHADNFIGRCGVGRGGETCKGCMRKNRKAKRRASRQARQEAKKETR